MSLQITHVGQTFWYVPDYGRARSIKVLSIGRKWATFEGLRNRVEIDTGLIDGKNYNPPGTLYSSEMEHAQKIHDAAVRDRFLRRLTRNHLSGVETENIEAAAKLLGISLEAA